MSVRLTCADSEPLLPFFLDDELDAEQALDVEAHLHACDDCRRQLQRQGRLRLALERAGEQITAPPRLHRRLHEALDQEERKQQRWVRLWPAFAAAAALMLFITRTSNTTEDMDEAASRHARNLPMDVEADDAGQVQRYLSARLPFAVQLPTVGESPRRFGGRVTQLNNREAAYVRYELPGGQLAVFVYEARQQPLPEATPLYRLGGQPVQVRRVHGYTTARWQSGDLVYAVVTDLPESELPRLLQVRR